MISMVGLNYCFSSVLLNTAAEENLGTFTGIIKKISVTHFVSALYQRFTFTVVCFRPINL